MERISSGNWQSAVVSPETVIQKIKPGMSIFLGTAVAEPRTMVRHLMKSGVANNRRKETYRGVSLTSYAYSIKGDIRIRFRAIRASDEEGEVFFPRSAPILTQIIAQLRLVEKRSEQRSI